MVNLRTRSAARSSGAIGSTTDSTAKAVARIPRAAMTSSSSPSVPEAAWGLYCLVKASFNRSNVAATSSSSPV